MFFKKLWNKKGKILKRIGLALWLLLTIASLGFDYLAVRTVGTQQMQIEQMKRVTLEGAEASRRADQYLRMLETHTGADPLWIALNTPVPRVTSAAAEGSGIPEVLQAECENYFVAGEYGLVSTIQVGGAVFIEVMGTPQAREVNVGLELVLFIFVYAESENYQLYARNVQSQSAYTWAEANQQR